MEAIRKRVHQIWKDLNEQEEQYRYTAKKLFDLEIVGNQIKTIDNGRMRFAPIPEYIRDPVYLGKLMKERGWKQETEVLPRSRLIITHYVKGDLRASSPPMPDDKAPFVAALIALEMESPDI